MIGTINYKDAIRAASAFASDALGVPGADFRLEEIVLQEQPHRWLITLSYPIGLLDRNYKELEVDAHSGDVRAMRIRQLT